jgi:hypothetical protein
MTYCKYSYFLMHENGPEYETTCRAGTAAPFSGIYYCEAYGGSINFAHSRCRRRTITLTRRRRVRFGGGWLLAS